MLPPLILEKVKINTVQVMDQFPVISMSTRFHDKTVETANNPVYNVPCFFFCCCCCRKRFLCVFKTVSTQQNLFVCNILSKRILKHRPSAQNTFIDVTKSKDEYRTVYGPVPNRLPVISMSTRSHDKTVETPDNPVCDVLFFFFFFFFFFFL